MAKKHPEWTEVTVSTRVSDAFYIWNNTVMPGFWKVFVSDESMEIAKENIRKFLKNEVKSDRFDERTRGYFRELTLLKEFFDTVHGGVKNCIGSEFAAEEVIYSVCKKYYDETVTEQDALDELCEKVPSFSRTSLPPSGRSCRSTWEASAFGKSALRGISTTAIPRFLSAAMTALASQLTQQSVTSVCGSSGFSI